MGLKVVFLVLVVTTTTLAWPWQNVDRCAKTCKNMPGYQINKRYIYDYSISVSSLVNGTSDEDSSVVLNCKANIEVIDDCEMVLKVSEVQLQEKNQDGSFSTSENNEHLRVSLMDKDLRFSYDEGRISSLCPEDDEKPWILNFKRGILSAFQGTSLQVMGSEPQQLAMETDVTGICPVHLKKISEDKTIKFKNFTGCQNRVKIDSSVQAIQLLPHAPTMNVLNCTQICEQQWGDQTLQLSSCREKHLVRPFSKGESGAVTTVEQFMQIADIQTISSSSRQRVNMRTDLLFQHIPKDDMIAKEELVSTLDEVCAKNDEVHPETAELFTKVAFQMRKLEKEPLKQVVNMVNGDQLCSGSISFKKFVIDALPVCESTACVGVMTDLIRSGDMDAKLVDAWIMSFAFLRHPSADMISDLTNLLKERDHDKSLYLSLSALVHRFCSENENCLNLQQITDTLDFFEETLRFDCHTNNNEERFKVMLALKALGNSGQAVSIIPTLDRCFEQKSNPIGIRIAAMEALRRIPCAKGNRDNMVDMYKDNKEDSEIRIEAFRGAMKCLNENMMDKVKRQMAIEKSEQVGSYVWTFMVNLNETSDPLKQELRTIVQESGILKEFNKDPRKFSRNMELSFFKDTMGVGATLESDVIFSSQSFVPRQASVASRIELFGFAIDLLEIGGRVEGIQQLLESFAGPNGYFQQNDLMDLLMTPERRQKRASIRDSTLDNLLENFDIQAEDMLQGSVYWKIFGNELGFADLSKLRDFAPGMPTTTMLQLMMELAKEKTIEYSKNMMLLEVSSEVPTCAGLPLKISVNGSASLKVKASGKLDLLQAAVAPRSLDISGKVEPSATIDVSTIMEVDFFVARTGVQHVARANTATSLEGSVQLTNGKVFKVNLNVPDKRLNIADIKSNLYLIRMEQAMEIQNNPETEMSLDMCTGSQVEKYFGVILCGQASFPSTIMHPNTPRFPLSGNTDIQIYLEKRDDSLTKYTLEASYKVRKVVVNEEVFKNDEIHFMVGTPNTLIKRTYSFDMTINRAEKNITIDLVTPTKTASLTADLVHQEMMQKLEVLFFIDDAQVMKLLSKLNFELENQRSKYIPEVKFEYNSGQETKTYRLMGSVTTDIERTDIDLVFNKPSENLITLSGNVQKNNGTKKLTYITDLNIGGRYIDARIDGEVMRKGNVLSSTITLEYVPPYQESRTMNFAMKLTDNTNDEFTDYDFMTSMSFSQNPKFNFRIDSMTKFNELHSESSHRFCYSNIDCEGEKVITVEHNFDLTKSENNLQNNLELTLRLPMLQQRYQITQTLERSFENPLNFVLDLDEIISTTKLFHTKLNLNNQGTEELPRGSFIFELATPVRDCGLTQTWNRVSATQLNAVTTLKTETDRTSTMGITWEKDDRNEEEYKKHSVSILFTTPDETEVSIVYYFELDNGELDTQLTTMKNNDRIVNLRLLFDDMTDSQKLKKKLTLTCMVPELETLKDVSFVTVLEYKEGSLFNFDSTLTLIQNKFVFATNLRNKTNEDKQHGEFVIRFETPENKIEFFSTAKLRGKLTTFETSVTFTPGEEEGSIFAIKMDYNNNTAETEIGHQLNLVLQAPDQSMSAECIISRTDDSFSSDFSLTYAPEKTIRNKLSFNNASTETEEVLEVQLTTTTPERSFEIVFNHRNSEARLNRHLEILVANENVLTAELNCEDKKDGNVKDIALTFDLPEEENDVKFNLIVSKSNSGKGLEFTIIQADDETLRLEFDLVPVITKTDKQFDIVLSLVNTYITGYDLNMDFMFASKNKGASVFVGSNVTIDGTRQLEIYTGRDTLYSNKYRGKVAYIFKGKLPEFTQEPFANVIFNFTNEYENEQISQFITFIYGDLSDDYKICMERESEKSKIGNNQENHHTLHLKHPYVLSDIPQDMSLDITNEVNDIERTSKVKFIRNGLTTTFSSRYRNKTNDKKIHHMAELIISRPEGHDITIKGVGKMFDGTTMFSTDLDVSYSSDKKKDISFSFDVSNNTVAEYTSDYTMAMEVLHLFSNVDVTLACSFTNDTERGSIGLESQVAIDDDYIPIAFEGEFNKLSRKYQIHTNGPWREMWFRGQAVTIEDGLYRIDMSNQYDNKVMPSYLQLDFINKEIQYKFMFDEDGDEYWHITMGYFNDTALEADLVRMIQGELTKDAHIRVVLTEPKVLRNEIHWRPEWIDEMNATIYQTIDRINKSMISRGNSTLLRMKKFSDRLHASIMDFVEENSEYRTMINELMYDAQIKFYSLKSQLDVRQQNLKTAIDRMKDDLAMKMRPALVKLNMNRENMIIQIQELIADLQRKLQLWAENAEGSLKNYAETIFNGRMIDELEMFADDTKDSMNMDTEYIKQQLNRTFTDIRDRQIKQFEMVTVTLQLQKETMKQLFSELRENIKVAFSDRFSEMNFNFKQSTFYTDLMTLMVNIQNNEIVADIMSSVNQTMNEIYQTMNETQNSEGVIELKSYLSQIIEYRRSQISLPTNSLWLENVRECIMKAIENMYEKLHEELQKYNTSSYSLESYDIENGEIVFLLFLHDEWQTLTQWPEKYTQDYSRDPGMDIEEYMASIYRRLRGYKKELLGNLPAQRNMLFSDRYLESLKEKWGSESLNDIVDQYIQVSNEFWSQVYMIKRLIQPKNLIPPYQAHAMLMGNEHFITFDKSYFDFSNKCSYVLASDFIDGNFTVLVDYDRTDDKNARSLVVKVDGETIEITADWQVKRNDRFIDLPIQFEKTTIIRDNGIIRVHNTNGVTVRCNLYSEYCTVNVTGWYFGKTGGLFGNYNYEPKDDMTKSNGRVTDNVPEFARSWQVGRKCTDHDNDAKQCNTDHKLLANEKCAKLFLDFRSQLSPCFTQVDRNKFYRMCVNQQCGLLIGHDIAQAVCNVSNAYRQQCYEQGVKLRPLKECVMCKGSENQDFELNDRESLQEDDDKPQSADIVFVVEEKPCAEEIAKRLPDIADSLNTELKKQGMKENRFGLVGFGGPGIHDLPHMHTIDHEIFNHQRKLQLGIDALEFGEGGNNDTFKALEKAANYPFRAGVAKNVILISCSECQDTKLSYMKISRMIIKRGINFNILMNYNFTFKKTAKDIKIYGIDERYAFTKKPSTDQLGDADLRRLIKEPTSKYAILALETNGTIFDMQSINDKKFIDVFTQRMLQTTVPMPCQECKCVADNEGNGITICEKCFNPFMSSPYRQVADMQRYISEFVKPKKPNKKTNTIKQ